MILEKLSLAVAHGLGWASKRLAVTENASLTNVGKKKWIGRLCIMDIVSHQATTIFIACNKM